MDIFNNVFESISTGNYSEEHGIVGNTMVMHEENETLWFSDADSKDSDSPFWQDATPIWISAIKQGLRAAVYSWPGADVCKIFMIPRNRECRP